MAAAGECPHVAQCPDDREYLLLAEADFEDA